MPTSASPLDPSTIMPDRYLGDGVYASYDGYHIVLDLRGQDSTTRIALEGEVFTSLIKYRTDLFVALDALNKA